jgi:hypothetical protein
LVLALCGRGLVGLVHLGVLDVTPPADIKKAPEGAFLLMVSEIRLSAGRYAGGLNPTHLPRNQDADEEHNGQAHAQSQSGGHAPFGGSS